MEKDDLLDRLLDATLDGDDVDHESFLSEGGEELAGAVLLHQMFQSASKDWQEPKRPTQLDRFEIVGDLGAGGIGKVYLGWDPDLRRHVAIKVISRDRWASNEARSIAKLDRQSIVKVYEVGRDYLVMELLDGGTLQDKINDIESGFENNMSPLRARLHCLVRIAQGLAYCHDRGILHRDVKPSNVLFAVDDEHPRLIDFGLAHLDELESLDITQNLVGSPAYLAPEQVQSGETGTDLRADIFSFGTLAYELLTLTSPFRRETRQETMDAVAAAQVTDPRKLNPEISRAVTNILAHCMEHDPRSRYASMHELATDLQDALADRPISVGSRSIIHRGQLFMKRHRRVSGFASLGVGLATVIAMGLWVRSLRGDRAVFAQKVDSLDSRIEVIDSGHEFNKMGLSLLKAGHEAQLLDQSILGRTIHSSKPPVQEAIKRWSERVAIKLDELSNFDTGRHPPAIWRAILSLDEAMLPGDSRNSVMRARGRVSISDEIASNPNLVVYRQEPLELVGKNQAIRVYNEAVLVEHPDAGIYRLEIPGVWQREIVVDSPWCAPIHVELRLPRLETTSWTHLEEHGVVISPLITVAQARALNPKYGGLSAAPESPFLTSMKRAQEFAEWAGGRLITGTELDALFDTEVEIPILSTAGKHFIDHSEIWGLDQGGIYTYANKLKTPTPPLHSRVLFFMRALQVDRSLYNQVGNRVGTGFRIAYPSRGTAPR